MSRFNFSRMNSDDWSGTRNAVQSFCSVLGDFKSNFSSHQKNWDEHGLRFYAKGFTTGPVPVTSENKISAIDLNLNFYEHKLKIFCREMRLSVPLEEQSIFSFTEEVITIINGLGITCDCDYNKYSDKTPLAYEPQKAVNFWNNIYQVYFILQKFKSRILEETSDILLWPHHFDSSVLWFSGNIIKGKDIGNWSESREQMNFGFSPGDEVITEPYFYITAYPHKDELKSSPLPGKAYWNDGNWNGAVLKYNELVDIDNPDKLVLEFFNTVLENNKKLIG